MKEEKKDTTQQQRTSWKSMFNLAALAKAIEEELKEHQPEEERK